jgi:hypothetical protein
MSIWHWLIILILNVILPFFPASKILKRAGLSQWWVVLYLIPFVSLIALFVFANSEWPRRSEV